MSDTRAKIEMGEGSTSKFDLFGELKEQVEKMCADMPEIEVKALNIGAYIIRQAIKSSLISKWPAAGRPFTVKTPKSSGAKQPYITRTDPIAEGVRQSRVRNGVASIAVTGGDPNTGSYLAKIYNTGSKTRYIKNRLGKAVRPPKSIGYVKGLAYFEPGVGAGEAECFNAMENFIFRRMEEIYN